MTREITIYEDSPPQQPGFYLRCSDTGEQPEVCRVWREGKNLRMWWLAESCDVESMPELMWSERLGFCWNECESVASLGDSREEAWMDGLAEGAWEPLKYTLQRILENGKGKRKWFVDMDEKSMIRMMVGASRRFLQKHDEVRPYLAKMDDVPPRCTGWYIMQVPDLPPRLVHVTFDSVVINGFVYWDNNGGWVDVTKVADCRWSQQICFHVGKGVK